MKIGTMITGVGVVTTINLNYLPEKLAYVAATQLSGLKVEVLGEGVICDLDGTGLTAVGRLGLKGYPTNGYVIPLADGKIFGKNVTITLTNSAAQTPSIFAYGDNKGLGYIKSTRSKVFANTNAEFSRFAALCMPSLAASDRVTVQFEDGLTEILEREDLEFRVGEVQNATGYYLLNFDGVVENAQVLGASDQSVYVVKFGL
jgi:hypothetical protein